MRRGARDWCTHHCAGEALKSREHTIINEDLEDILSLETGMGKLTVSMGTL